MYRLLCFLAVLIASTGLAQDADKGTLDATAQEIQSKILDDDKVRIENLKVLHKDGHVYLEGIADLFGSRYRAEKYATETKGVQTIDNQIAVKAAEVTDLDIQSHLMDRVMRHLRSEPFDLLSVKVSHGFVTLSGSVRDVTLIKKTFEEAIWTRGVRDVDNRIRAASVGAGDERLRRAIFQRLNREFPQYFLGRFPSFVILVDSGRVTLVGSVNSQGDKYKIASIIRSMIGVLSVDNLLEAK